MLQAFGDGGQNLSKGQQEEKCGFFLGLECHNLVDDWGEKFFLWFAPSFLSQTSVPIVLQVLIQLTSAMLWKRFGKNGEGIVV